MDSVAAALHAIRVERFRADAALWSILLAPLIVLAVIRWLADRRPKWPQGVVYLSGCATVISYTVVALFFAMCAGGETGESGKSQLVKAYSLPVLGALARFQTDSGHFPAALEQLVPKYLDPEVLRAPERPPLGFPFEYRRDNMTFELHVRFAGPGMNDCRYRPAAGWACGGYF